MLNNAFFKSKNNLDVTVRPAVVEDAESLLNLKLGYLENTQTIPLFIDEYKNTKKDEEILINKLVNQKNSNLFVAEHNGQLIGNIDITGNQRRKLLHTAMLGMGVEVGWQGLGVGTMLINTALSWSITNEYLKIIILDVYENNKSGVALYNKVGFKNCGLIEDFFQEEGRYINKIQMVYSCIKA